MLAYVTDRFFKVDDAGNTLFYPYGSAWKGYIVPSKEVETKIRNFIAAWYACCVIVMAVFLFSGHAWWLFLFILPSLMIWELRMRAFGRILITSPVKLKFAESMKRYSESHSRIWLWFIALISFFMTILFAYTFIAEKSIWLGAGLLFFVVMSSLSVYILSLKAP
jgi:hypothetical protein